MRKVTTYIKTIAGRNAGRLIVVKFHKVTKNKVHSVDVTRNKIKSCKTFGSIPYTEYPSTKKEYEEAHNKVMEFLNLSNI